MTRLLAKCFGMDVQTFEKWSLEEASGCLGQELKIVLERTCSVGVAPCVVLPVTWNLNLLE